MLHRLAIAVALALVNLAHAVEPVPVVLADRENLQDMPFFVALGAGYFRDEGLSITLETPDAPSETPKLLHAGTPQVAILPPPIYLQLIADRFPMRIVANLLQNDPINLVVRRTQLEARHIVLDSPLRTRLLALAGLRLGIAPGPVSRLRALFKSEGLEAEKIVTIVRLMGEQQNDAFARGEVDALYAHTPFLERAIVQQEAVVVVNQSAGEVPRLATRMIHALVVSEAMLEKRPSLVAKIVRALARAERLIHADEAATVRALLAAVPTRPRELVATIVHLYAPAVPKTPAIDRAGLRSALALFPATKIMPQLSDADLDAHLDNSFVSAMTKISK
jgi:ABC-type nitrate/sulfonate/bicarbonate transport system substrate-binding protein